MTREEAARILKYLWIEQDENAKYLQQLTTSFFERQEAIRIAIAALRKNPCDNCVGPGLAIAHGYKDMRTKKPEVEG